MPTTIRSRTPVRALARFAVAALLATGGALAAPVAASAASPYERGPAPTSAILEASRGPFATSSINVSSLSVTGFGGGVIYYPTSTAEGTFGAVAISPGYTASWSSLSWLGPRIASHGFVVIGIETNTRLDQPASRGRQLLAALDYLTERSSVRGRIDSSRLAVAGHSMGGGGSLEAAAARPSLQAAVPLAPWNLDKTWSDVRVPTLIIGGETDSVAPVATHSIPFYNSIPASSEKAYLELDGASHFFPQTTNTPTAKQMVAWLKRFVDDDTRYEQFLCPGPSGSAIQEYRNTCPSA
ncbi:MULTISPECIES: alpha/beta hydrolase family protein [Micromonospora]|uniref:Alpha/beta hydrolase n=1 Tax=Micromonospora chalcea TaxID=1874 RepID=A0ABX9YDE3_MICCH|nr:MULTISPECIES: lipase [Micromonospora]MBQ1059499.1 alpha/beta hydrolase [Micromonospora sp. C41]MCK1805498.1 alpha/beta hydrolase [Micromonospora sp. R42106]MCK1832915.1 alpha/beta hydrolase [Micromonospora sp. R42003]MCK1844541.1 alpha/beta hydrolase [Micromonospora sp. R42004]MCM1014914.1 alpha/beta hydrolase [Micromonospora sp. XM-20-01]